MASSSSSRMKEEIRALLSVPSGNPALTIAQFEAFSKQVPLMYFILLTNMAALAWTHATSSPRWLVVYLPLVMAAVGIARILSWLAPRRHDIGAEEAYARLRSTNRVAGPITLVFTVWALALLPYGDAYQRSHVVFFMAITVIGCIFCLMHLRSAALMVIGIVNLPFFVTMFVTGEPTFIAMGVNVLLVTVAMLAILMTHYRDFRWLNESRQALIEQQEALNERNLAIQALSDENLRLANLDSLTSLQNRRSFFHMLDQRFDFARRAGEVLAVGVIDLDGFKPINDMYGHAAGDKVLVEIAGRLSRLSSDRHLAFRMGGDEFGMILVQPDGEAELLRLARVVCDAICEPINIGSGTVQVTASIGFAVFPDVGNDAQSLYEKADYALYSAKRHHRAGAVVFNVQQAEELGRQKVVEDAMAVADLARELSLVFQPIVEAGSGRCRGFEALARWNSSTIGAVSPAEFVPVAEHTGRITVITRLLLERALSVARTWPDGIGLSFNLSAHDLASSDGILRIIGIVKASGFDPGRITFEITETAVLHDFEQAKASIVMLRRLGAGIALDDFGTGYSSLHHVHKLPLTRIKIDGSFVRDIENDMASRKIVKSLLSLCAEMEFDAVVEGVETAAELAIVREMGAQFVQGYYFSRPLRSEDAISYVSGTVSAPPRRKRA
jgi:diguanylate cyclase (GGDEF)-like protein